MNAEPFTASRLIVNTIKLCRSCCRGKTKDYRYFCVYTTDMTLEVPEILRYYRQRWQIETAFRDVKQNFGFDTYQVKTEKSINRFVQLSVVAATLTQLLFTDRHAQKTLPTPRAMCRALDIHWYKPRQRTRGVMVQYLRSLMWQRVFTASTLPVANSHNIPPMCPS